MDFLSKCMRNKKGVMFLIGCFLMLMMVLVLIFGTYYTVDTGEVSIVSRFGRVVGVSEPGPHLKVPFVERREIMITRDQSYLIDSMSVSTKDMQTITLKINIQAKVVDPMLVYKSFKNNYDTSLIGPRAREIIQANVSNYTIEEFISERQKLSNEINVGLEKELIGYGIEVRNISILDHDFSPEYDRAIERKKIAEQEQERASIENQTALNTAKSKANIAKELLSEKKTLLEVNKLEAATLNEYIIMKAFIEKWDGKMPQTVVGSPMDLMLKKAVEK